MPSLRKQFLDVFLGAFGAVEIRDYSETPTSASGTLRYAPDSEFLDLSDTGDDDFQDFRWSFGEDHFTHPLALILADLIFRYQLLDVDRLRVSRDTLFRIFSEDSNLSIDRSDFDNALDALQSIRVAMIENGEEVDAFFIHE